MFGRLFSLISLSWGNGGMSVDGAPSEPPSFPPYGTLIGTGSEPRVLNYWYSSGFPNSESPSQFIFGSTGYNVYADGNGGSYINYTSASDSFPYDYVIDNSETQPNSRIIYKSNGNWSECPREASNVNYQSGNRYVYPSEAGYSQMQIGTYSQYDNLDGVCGTTTIVSDSYYSYGTSIGYSNGYNFYSDGNGGYYYESSSPSYPPYGEYLYGDGGTYSFSWYESNSGASGTYEYGYYGCSYYADGIGGSYSSCGGGTYQSYGFVIYTGSYDYQNGTDEYGNPQYSSQNFKIVFDGNSGYFYDYT